MYHGRGKWQLEAGGDYDAVMLHWSDLCYLAAGAAYLPVLGYQAVFERRHRQGWGERFGRLRPLPPHPCRIWVHGVSLGEINATRTLIPALEQALPEAEVVISSTTDTGYARARQLYPQHYVFRYPLDFSPVVRRVLDHIRPAMIVLVELELWYNLVRLAGARGVRLAVVNGRLSERSVRRYGWVRPLASRMLRACDLLAVQDETYAARFAALGAPPERIVVTGSMKYDTAPASPQVDGAESLGVELGIDRSRPLWVCGSTGPGEEEMILRAYERLRAAGVDVQLAIVPRKPERFDEVAALIERRGFRCVRRSQGRGVMRGDEGRPVVYLGDTLGELRKFYALCTVAFVGRSLVPMGGSDVIEVAALGRPIVVGPHTENFASAVRQLREAGALMVIDGPEALVEVGGLVGDAQRCRAMGEAALRVVQANRGATQRTVEALRRVLAAPATGGVSAGGARGSRSAAGL